MGQRTLLGLRKIVVVVFVMLAQLVLVLEDVCICSLGGKVGKVCEAIDVCRLRGW
jgi:hypothetical protein